MESMSGARWNARVHEENAAFERALSQTKKDTLLSTTKKFQEFQEEHDKECRFIIEHGTSRREHAANRPCHHRP